MQIRRASAEDCRAIAEVHVASWKAAYAGIVPADYLAALSVEMREAMWREAVATGAPSLLVAKAQEQILGFAAFGKSRDEDAPPDRAELYAIYLSPASWSSGVGRGLWLSALEAVRAEGYVSTSLWVIAGNERAIKFYSRAGFVPEAGATKQFMLGGATLSETRFVHSDDG